jgi:cysteine-rich repeat protein
MFFTEGGFGGTSRINIVTDAELSPACESCSTVIPASTVVSPTTFDASFSAFSVVPTFTNIPPSEFVLTPTECEPGSGDLECEDLSIVSSVMRYPTPISESGPAGMTGIVDREGLKVIFGSLEGVDHLFEFESCALISSCGDGIVDPGEACDDGNPLDGDGCSSECLLESGVPGRMTGGGRINDGPLHINHGQTLRCDAAREPQRLEVNWRAPRGGGAKRFHLTDLVSAVCSDDPAIDQGVPKSSMFDTFSGVGIGRYNGEPGATITFVLKDAGEPGREDTSSFLIEDAGGTVVLDVESTTLNKGNNQAH